VSRDSISNVGRIWKVSARTSSREARAPNVRFEPTAGDTHVHREHIGKRSGDALD
jgi:hypothetical protein